jgi:SAM-dependent methyltransferase
VLGGVPRLLPKQAASALSERTLQSFGDEWQRFPELLSVHERIFDWYFEGPRPMTWKGLEVLDAGCGMGRWLHFARRAGAEIVGMDVSPAIDVAAAREGDAADFVQADLRFPPFAPESFDLVYCLGVLHHLEQPLVGVRALAKLVRPGGELRFYVYRSLDGEPFVRRLLLAVVTALRQLTTRLPYAGVHALAWVIAAAATLLFLWPHRFLRRFEFGERWTGGLPLVHYADVPFRMLVSEQFDRLVAPIEGRLQRSEVEALLNDIGFESVAILPGLGWRAIGRRPAPSA